MAISTGLLLGPAPCESTELQVSGRRAHRRRRRPWLPNRRNLRGNQRFPTTNIVEIQSSHLRSFCYWLMPSLSPLSSHMSHVRSNSYPFLFFKMNFRYALLTPLIVWFQILKLIGTLTCHK